MKEKLPFLNWMIENNIPYRTNPDNPEEISVDEEVLQPHYQTLMKLFPLFRPPELDQRENLEPNRIGD